MDEAFLAKCRELCTEAIDKAVLSVGHSLESHEEKKILRTFMSKLRQYKKERGIGWPSTPR